MVTSQTDRVYNRSITRVLKYKSSSGPADEVAGRSRHRIEWRSGSLQRDVKIKHRTSVTPLQHKQNRVVESICFILPAHGVCSEKRVAGAGMAERRGGAQSE